MVHIQKSSKQAIIGITLFSLIMIWIFYGIIQRVNLSNNYLYTIGYTEGRRSTHKGEVIDYSFTYNKLQYKSSKHLVGQSPKEVNGRYYVKFLPTNPDVNDIYWNTPVPNHIIEAPPEGWKEIPE